MTSAVKTQSAQNDRTVSVDGHELHLTNFSKIYFPVEKITKGDVINYYTEMARYILPYLKDRPESMRRNPNGIIDEGFFHKDAGEEAPDWVETFLVHSDSGEKDVNYILCNNPATLMYMNNLGCIEINPWFSRINKPDYPDYSVIDIDPSEANSFEEVIETALAIKDVLDRAGIEGFCKTSGATGMHVFIPLGARYEYSQAKDFAHLIASLANELLPETTTLERSLNKRSKKIYLDYLQNRRGQTLASVYSLRPRPGATASAPLKWDEVKKGLHPSDFTIKTLSGRVLKTGDLFREVLGKGIDIIKSLNNLGA